MPYSHDINVDIVYSQGKLSTYQLLTYQLQISLVHHLINEPIED